MSIDSRVERGIWAEVGVEGENFNKMLLARPGTLILLSKPRQYHGQSTRTDCIACGCCALEELYQL